jgi:hypothetical protein
MFGKAPTVRGGGGKLWGKTHSRNVSHRPAVNILAAGYTVHITEKEISLQRDILYTSHSTKYS